MLDYTELSSAAEDILDFAGSEGLTFTVDHVLTPRFGRQLTVGVLDSGPSGVAFRWSSRSQPAGFASLLQPQGIWEEAGAEPLPGSLVVGSLYRDLGVEAQVEHWLAPRLRLGATCWSSCTPRPEFQLHGHGWYVGQRVGAKLLYMSEEHWVGLSWLWALPAWRGWQVGAELLGSLKEKVPGASFGCRRVERDAAGRLAVLTGTVSPISGHLTSTYTAALSRTLAMSTRFEFNMYSAESDLAVGLDLRPTHGPFRLRARLGLSDGFGVLLECTLAQLRFAFTAVLSFKEPFRQAVGLDITYMP
eukprot:comp24245_c0_seq1/m.44857 comp24245_c0_seq1/g.44857  ORF comp24245_c0_seq1/g.44857 comp24245_c0_seq1/m.44857 type:complete len:303 (-) comp24245_c0_seq1:726-1634(-)